jgi:hypothetical protein
MCKCFYDVEINRLRWPCHVIRRESEEIYKKRERKRKIGRPRMRWMDEWCGE